MNACRWRAYGSNELRLYEVVAPHRVLVQLFLNGERVCLNEHGAVWLVCARGYPGFAAEIADRDVAKAFAEWLAPAVAALCDQNKVW